jgi:hypothetical protein
MVLGGVFALIVVVAVAGIAIVAVRGSGLDKESREYVDAAVPEILSKWDITEIQNRASPEFKAAVKSDDLEKLVRVFRRLGTFKAYNGAKGQARIAVMAGQGKVISAAYVVSADFETGPAEIKLSLIKHGDQWQLLGISAFSKVFLEQFNQPAGAAPSTGTSTTEQPRVPASPASRL